MERLAGLDRSWIVRHGNTSGLPRESYRLMRRNRFPRIAHATRGRCEGIGNRLSSKCTDPSPEKLAEQGAQRGGHVRTMPRRSIQGRWSWAASFHSVRLCSQPLAMTFTGRSGMAHLRPRRVAGGSDVRRSRGEPLTLHDSCPCPRRGRIGMESNGRAWQRHRLAEEQPA